MDNKEFKIKLIKDAVDSFRDVPDDDVYELVLGLNRMNKDTIAMGIALDRQMYDLFFKIKNLRLCSEQLSKQPLVYN